MSQVPTTWTPIHEENLGYGNTLVLGLITDTDMQTVLCMKEKDYIQWMAKDKDGNPYVVRVTHYRRLPSLPKLEEEK